ncbi:hypothetical protein GOP47_0029085 [Adiantum capillus-veneris]|nr:hypothetical protein GOP47_0029085 [Adiantum capillus-veneris]
MAGISTSSRECTDASYPTLIMSDLESCAIKDWKSIVLDTWIENPRELAKKLSVVDWEEMSDKHYDRFVTALGCGGVSFDWFTDVNCYLALRRRDRRRAKDVAQKLEKEIKDTDLVSVMKRWRSSSNDECEPLDEELCGLPPFSKEKADKNHRVGRK